MYDTTTHVNMVKARIRRKRRARAQRGIILLSALCAAVFIALAGVTGTLAVARPAACPGLYGSMLLEDAGGYVLVGVISFTAAVVLTVLCIHIREKRKRREETKGGEEG